MVFVRSKPVTVALAVLEYQLEEIRDSVLERVMGDQPAMPE